MSNVIVRKQNGDKPATTRTTQETFDPWRAVRALLGWDPFQEMMSFPVVEERTMALQPAFDVKETKDGYIFKADVPGIQDKDLEVTITGNRLNVTGRREQDKEEKTDRYYAYERSYGAFTRSFTLPDGANVDQLRASLDGGVLTITLPKKPEVQPKKIPVKAESTGAKPEPSAAKS